MKFLSGFLLFILSLTTAFANDEVTTIKENTTEISNNSYGPARPDLSGMRLMGLTGPAIYVVSPEGYLQLIPNPNVYHALFRNWDNITHTDVNLLAMGPSLSDTAQLVKKVGAADVYLLSNGMKRPITEAGFNKYNFAWDQIVTYPQSFIDMWPTGPLWQ